MLLWISRLPIPTPFPAHSPGRTGARGSRRPWAQPSQSYRDFSIRPGAQTEASLISLELLLSRGPGRGLPGPGALLGVQGVGKSWSLHRQGSWLSLAAIFSGVDLGELLHGPQLRQLWTA